MPNTVPTFKSFADLARHQHTLDMAAAAKLKKSRALANKKPGTGPRIVKVSA